MTSHHDSRGSVLGIDIGSVSLSVVQLDFSGQILAKGYYFHKGNLRETLFEAQQEIDISSVTGIACTNGTGLNQELVQICNTQVAVIRATREVCPEAGSILMVGAEKFFLVRLDEKGTYQDTRTNSSCASGTGSFLDQQAFRLNLAGTGELSEKAMKNRGKTPDIASRCSVFAKTDLIHAQQRGYSPEAICDGLCKGLAKNIVDTLFSKDPPALPLFFTGGVSRNEAVVKHLEAQLGYTLIRNEYSHLSGSLGAAFWLLSEKPAYSSIGIKSLGEIQLPQPDKLYFHKPLIPDKNRVSGTVQTGNYLFIPSESGHSDNVQVEDYKATKDITNLSSYLGIDIGSTSTKAIITGHDRIPVAGFYTYTAGNPLNAIRAIFEAITEFSRKRKIGFSFKGAGVTGSGRKFIGKIIGADRTYDEITAHAKAAYELNPNTDTIIEIGGQDSKFTLMQEGMVTFSQMNTVCAAGTGSFLEEQAEKIGISIAEFAEKAEGVMAPLASDRCTVFMERDINQLYNKGYSVNEILATVLHSVMENYLRKVAAEASIGDHVCFQGATARNRSLVAAFEQKLQKQIFVSDYCHLTGALGVALLLQDENLEKKGFRGVGLYREQIPIISETCNLCPNYCHISVAEVQGQKEAYGFLCGRDYQTKKLVKRIMDFDLLEERRKIFTCKHPGEYIHQKSIGLPASLHLFEEMPLWRRFFDNLSIRTVTSEKYNEPVRAGKRLAGAEFCAPVNAIYGHTVFLADKADYIFLPVMLESREKPKKSERNYCYYTQFSASLVYTLKQQGIHKKCISPFIDSARGNGHTARVLRESLDPVLDKDVSVEEIRKAYEEAQEFHKARKSKLGSLFNQKFKRSKDISVALMGRPYVVFSRSLNKGIPDILAGMGIQTYFQDMLPEEKNKPDEVNYLLRKVPWNYAAKILETAITVASTAKLYPVLITAFKCAPDSFIIEYFRKILSLHRKPYLILQIDEHDSNVGYETRIEAAIRSFRNHASKTPPGILPKSAIILPHVETTINNRTLLMPGWDSLVAPLVVANLKRSGIDARLLESGESIIKKSMVHNTGQCLPLNIITQEFIDYIEKHGLKPENTILWMMESKLTCNLRLYPYYMKSLLESYGNGLEKALVYSGKLTHFEISYRTSFNAYFAYMLGGLLRSLGCMIRPYEDIKGETDRAIKKSISILEKAFTGEIPMDEAVSESIALFGPIGRTKGMRPKAAIFGDFYVRDNDVMNQNLIHFIENAGGEVISTPYSDYVKITIENVLRRQVNRGDYFETGVYRVLLNVLKLVEEKYYRYFRQFLGPPPETDPKRLEKNLEKFNINLLHSGESYDNILKIFYIMENHPDIALFVQTNPAFCCPSLVTEAMTHEIKRITGIPVVTITYDGTNEYKNDIILPYLQAK
ncbi:MAG: hypothetical protein JSV24_08180 [Bacteroidales bacterium]|nr:MAG: hypothetical protein JSV24_08180 [Bacteroidales bacterium]